MKILLVDDEIKFVSALAERLALRGLQADWATSCDDALAMAAREQYSLAVLDVKMPSMSGIELKRRLEKLWPGMKYIFITGHGSEEDYEIGCEEAFCYIIKPFNIEHLTEKIKQALNT